MAAIEDPPVQVDDVDSDADAQPDVDSDADAQPDVDTDADAQPDVDTDADAQPDVDPELGDEEKRQALLEQERETEALMEERGKKLDRLGVYVGKKLVEIFGDEAADELELCELCTWTHTYGWRVPTLPPEQVRDAVKIAIGFGTIDEMQSFSAFTTCDTCNGLGNVKTGSHVTSQLYRQCPTCQGRGYNSSLDADTSRTAVGTPVAAMSLVDGEVPLEPDTDMFGTPRGHPDYGKLAQHREVPISAWAHNLPQ